MCGLYTGAIAIKYFLAAIASQQDYKTDKHTKQKYFLLMAWPISIQYIYIAKNSLVSHAMPCHVSTLSQSHVSQARHHWHLLLQKNHGLAMTC